MAKFNTQFHALASELAEFAETWMGQYAIHATTFAFSPFRAATVTREQIHEAIASPEIRTIMFTQNAPDLSSTAAQLETLDRNPGALLLDIGRLGPRGLPQSSLGTMDANPIWKKINNDLKRRTIAGAEVLNEKTGIRGYERNFRFTPGAKALSESGTALRQFAQGSVVFFPRAQE